MLAVVDFETESIEPRPAYPPEPVGVALYLEGQRPQYLAWGHPHDTGNNCTKSQARTQLLHLWKTAELVFHNAAFDLEVALDKLGLPLPPWHRFHDTMFLAFLHDPNAPALGLKELGKKILHREPDPQARLRDWIHANVPGARRKKEWAAYISQAPGNVVAPYAKEDVRLTYKLFHKLKQYFGPAYDRERKLLPILLKMSRDGMPTNAPGLEEAYKKALKDLEAVERWIRRRLSKPNLDFAAADDLADALEDAGLVRGSKRKGFEWLVTEKTQKRSVRVDALREVVTDQDFVDVLVFRSILSHQIRTFVRPWLGMDDCVHCNWNQVRHHEAHRQYGARTGRLSSNPNLQNVPMRLQPIRYTKRGEGLYVPVRGASFVDLRSFVQAPRGLMLADADYSQQELRVLAHFTGGQLAAAYQRDPHLDMHVFAQNVINAALPVHFTRGQSKSIGLGIIYGMGLDALAERTGSDRKTASLVRRTYKQRLGIETLDETLRAQKGCMTWGGRWYDVEPPVYIDGDFRSFEYKLINTVVQGSSADVTKEAMIRYDDRKKDGRLVLTVHDELVLIAPRKAVKSELKILCEAMESVELKVPLIADGKVGKTWREAH